MPREQGASSRSMAVLHGRLEVHREPRRRAPRLIDHVTRDDEDRRQTQGLHHLRSRVVTERRMVVEEQAGIAQRGSEVRRAVRVYPRRIRVEADRGGDIAQDE